MKKLLLTSGQVSLIFSISVTLIFTALLFLSGLTLQRRTLTHLHSTLRPNLPPIPHHARSLSPAPAPIRVTGSPDSPSARDYASYLSSRSLAQDQARTDWNRLAHVQVVASHKDVCSSVMFFADLHRLKSPAKRMLLFPETWLGDKAAAEAKEGAGEKWVREKKAEMKGWTRTKGDGDPYTASTRRLLRLAARRYRVELRPVGARTFGKSEEGSGEEGKGWFEWLAGSDDEEMERKREEARVVEEAGLTEHPLLAVMGLSDLERAMIMRTPGWILDATGLDGALAYSEMIGGGLSVVKDLNGTDVTLINPSGTTASALKEQILTGSVEDDLQTLSRAGISIQELDSPSESDTSEGSGGQQEITRLTRSISALHEPGETLKFNATAYLTSAAYITFTDSKLPAGPEYDVPFELKVAARPRNKEADWVWTKLYGSFAEKRREVCGLDLEGWYA